MLERLYYRKRYNWAVGNTGFPLSYSFGNYLNEPLFGEYWTGVYNEETNPKWWSDPHAHQLELARGERHAKGETVRVRIDEPCAVPYMLLGKGRTMSASVDGQTRALENLLPQRFYYLAAHKPGELALSGLDGDFVVGRPMPFKQRAPRRRKLVLNLFVDGLSFEAFKLVPFEQAAPNMARFFSKGTIFENCHVTSNWSLPGLASLFTGNRVGRHQLAHRSNDVTLPAGDPLMSELFQRDGYMTFQACGNWRKSPSYGYARGFDRTVYKRQLSLKDVNYAFFDQLRAFPERDTFAWLTSFDLHHIINVTPDLAEQVRYSLEAHDFTPSKDKSVLQNKINKPKSERYLREITKVDFCLGQIFSWLEANYSDDEMVVSLVADHGTGFMTPDPHMLKLERTHTPWMLRGAGVPAGRCPELVQNVDVLPTLLKLCGVDAGGAVLDGRVPQWLGGPAAREHILCEAYFPGSNYRATIKDLSREYYFESIGKVDDDGAFDASRLKEELYKTGDWENPLPLDARYAQLREKFLAGRAGPGAFAGDNGARREAQVA